MTYVGYKKIKTVGKGAFGTAVLYQNLASEKLVVIKEVNMTELTEAEKKMALNEVQVLSSLSHPNIIQYLSSHEVDGVLMIEMEYADGGTLAQLISHSSHLTEHMILSLFQQCVAAIEYMHANNILHRDLKTANVFLTKLKQVKVGDFGISKIMTSKGLAQTVLGTPYYISPEMCEGKQYSTKSDVWALGCILYEMACLHKTFRGENLSALVSNIVNINFEPIPSVYSEQLRRLVTSLLQKNPLSRPSPGEILAQVREVLLQAESNAVTNRKVRSVLYHVNRTSASFSCRPVPLPPTLEIMQVAVSNTHFITVSKDKIVHTWGEGKQGQLGHGDTTIWLQKPTVVQSLINKEIVAVGAGDGFSVFLSDSGLLMTCGDGTFGCLGLGDTTSTLTPQVVKALENEEVKQVACGDHHSVALTHNEKLFVWGCGECGQLGTGSEKNYYEPTRVVLKLTDAIRSIQCGPDCTAFITNKGSVYACGSNRHNKLGLARCLQTISNNKIITVKKILRFQKLHVLEPWSVADVSLAINHSAVLTECGRVVTMGSNAEAQVGHSSTTPSIVAAVGDKIATSVMCGPTYTIMTSVHNVVYFWGTRYFSRASPVHTEVSEKPEELLALYASQNQIKKGEMLNVKSISCLWNAILLLVDTTVPLADQEINESQQQHIEDYDTIGPVPKWFREEFDQAEN